MTINKNSLRVAKEQLWIPISLPIVQGNKDYQDYKDLLENIDHLLESSRIEATLQEQMLQKALVKGSLSEKAKKRIQLWTSRALRCKIVRSLSRESFRQLAFHLGESSLLQNFCRLVEFDRVRVPGKSTLQEFEDLFDEAQIRMITNLLTLATQGESLGFTEKPDLSVVLLDSTCVATNIHFPVDWVLLRDVVRTLVKAIVCIRRHGLHYRIQEPMKFLSKMNTLCIAMSQSSRRSQDSRKQRKEILRQMKKLVHCVEKHAKRYRKILDQCWSETDLTKNQACVILRRMDNILNQLPAAIKQAHERIIGERQVPNEKKILSLYETHSQVYHRGKAGCATEFGLQMLVGESGCGLIVDWDLVDGPPKNDTKHLMPCLERLQGAGINVLTAVGDKGFYSLKNSEHLRKEKITDALCPRNVIELRDRQESATFVALQKRRAQTEGRIGILKNRLIGECLPVKGMARQKRHVAFCVFSHNLWLLARMLMQEKKEREKSKTFRQAA